MDRGGRWRFVVCALALLGALATAPRIIAPSRVFASTPTGGWNMVLSGGPGSPAARTAGGMAFDAAQGISVLFGGCAAVDGSGNCSGALGDTWIWNGSGWTEQHPGSSPPARWQAGMAYDAATQTVLLFGGCSDQRCQTDLGDTWAWNGGTMTWTALCGTTGTQPCGASPCGGSGQPACLGARSGPGMARSGQHVILFGGRNSAGTNLSDTWAWSGSAWSDVSPSPQSSANTPPARVGAGMAYDAANARTVLFGGLAGRSGGLGDTWLWNGSSWSSACSACGPSSASQSIAYDGAAGLIRLLDHAGRTWVWSGSRWSQQYPSPSPPPASSEPLTDGSPTIAMLLFDSSGETWTWTAPTVPGPPLTVTASALDGSAGLTWAIPASNGGTALTGYTVTTSGANAPAPLSLSAATLSTTVAGLTDGNAYSFTVSAANALGAGPASAPSNSVTPVPAPIVQGVSPAQGSPAGGTAVSISGQNLSSTAGSTQIMFGANPATSVSCSPNQCTALSPGGPGGASVDVVVTIGAQTSSVSGADRFAYESGGNAWTGPSPGAGPPARSLAALAFDPANGNVVLFGGQNSGGGALGDTWTWDGGAWKQQSPSSSPAARSGAGIAFDAKVNRMLLFGGVSQSGNATTVYGDAWTWDGSAWTPVCGTASPSTPACGPAPRSGASLAYDAATGTAVLFGGFICNNPPACDDNQFTNETWTWDGAAWTQQQPATPPPILQDPVMVYDPATSSVLLYGEYSTNQGYFDGLWGWDGQNWTQVQTSNDPPALARQSLAYDAAAGAVVLFGGVSFSDGSFGADLNDTWVLNGSLWTNVSGAARPAARSNASLAYDSVHGVSVLFGGVDTSGSDFSDTWTWLGIAAPAPPAPVSATASTVVANPVVAAPDGRATSTISVTLETAAGNPVSGKTVSLGQGSGQSSISPASEASDGSGIVSFTVTDMTAETVTYTATDTSDSLPIKQQATVIFGTPQPGDVNGDGKVDATDALCILRIVSALPSSSACPRPPPGNPDVNGDPSDDGAAGTDATDALCLLRHVANLPTTGACPPFGQ